MIIIVDNYDSFVFNIARYFIRLGELAEVVRNDAVSVADIVAVQPGAIVISPGPGSPVDAGISMPLVRALSGRIPILGICLGHQCIGSVFGGRVERARRPMNGRSSSVSHQGEGVFEGLPSPLCVGRYHSLIVEFEETCSSDLAVTARSEDGEVMGLRHRNDPTYGVQFHPESILTQQGSKLLMNFVRLAHASKAATKPADRNADNSKQ
ncbi:para-aminobenzoate synthetase component 2 [Bradyrhizobium yuanmingense]|uniref:anthranilate synthase component II n=1 Tax=Bradyrhizobium yuanmingense TaxID=108015 RepID=UPI0035147189